MTKKITLKAVKTKHIGEMEGEQRAEHTSETYLCREATSKVGKMRMKGFI